MWPYLAAPLLNVHLPFSSYHTAQFCPVSSFCVTPSTLRHFHFHSLSPQLDLPSFTVLKVPNRPISSRPSVPTPDLSPRLAQFLRPTAPSHSVHLIASSPVPFQFFRHQGLLPAPSRSSSLASSQFIRPKAPFGPFSTLLLPSLVSAPPSSSSVSPLLQVSRDR